MTSSARHVFTLRHLVRRKFGANGVEDALIGPQSFPACLSNAIIQVGINWQFKSKKCKKKSIYKIYKNQI